MRQRTRRERLMHSTMRRDEQRRCIYCGALIRRVPLVPRPSARPSTHFIDQEPHPDGWVIRSERGVWRVVDSLPYLLTREPRFRVHGYRSCSDEAQWFGEQHVPRPFRRLAATIERVVA